MPDGVLDLNGPPLSAFDFDAEPLMSSALFGVYAFLLLLVLLIDFPAKKYFKS